MGRLGSGSAGGLRGRRQRDRVSMWCPGGGEGCDERRTREGLAARMAHEACSAWSIGCEFVPGDGMWPCSLSAACALPLALPLAPCTAQDQRPGRRHLSCPRGARLAVWLHHREPAVGPRRRHRVQRGRGPGGPLRGPGPGQSARALFWRDLGGDRLRCSIVREAKAHGRMKDASGKSPRGDKRREKRNATRVQKTFEDNVRKRQIAVGRHKTLTSKSRERTSDGRG